MLKINTQALKPIKSIGNLSKLRVSTINKRNDKQNQLTTQRSLNSSRLSSNSEHAQSNRKISDSFYNDHKAAYLNRSLHLVQNSTPYRSKTLSFSERKRYDSSCTEMAISKRFKNQRQDKGRLDNSVTANPQAQKDQIRRRYNSFAANKYKQLLYGEQMISLNKKMLDKDIESNNLQKQFVRKWSSPFLNKNTLKERFQGKQLLPKKINTPLTNTDPSQLKVLNLDRLFRLKEGKLTNVVPLPQTKLTQIFSRAHMPNLIKNKDRIHQVIEEYNKLLKIMQIKKLTPKLAVKGKNFTKSPTIEELMGIKLKPSKQLPTPQSEMLSENIFIQYCQYYRQFIKKDVHLTRRVLAGLRQDQPNKNLSLTAFTKFYTLFVNKIASVNQKISFLMYFFIPQGQEKIDFSVLKIILELMCEELPPIQKLNIKTDLLSAEQKSKIFLQALNRVLFSEIRDQLQNKSSISRNLLLSILQNNSDACDLLIQLLQIE